jgi:hypothetical protein
MWQPTGFEWWLRPDAGDFLRVSREDGRAATTLECITFLREHINGGTRSVRGPSHGVPCFIKERTLLAKFSDHFLDIHSLSLD